MSACFVASAGLPQTRPWQENQPQLLRRLFRQRDEQIAPLPFDEQQELLAVIGERDAWAVAIEEPDSQLVFQGFNL